MSNTLKQPDLRGLSKKCPVLLRPKYWLSLYLSLSGNSLFLFI